jgi:hypothetical protein
MYMVIWCGIRPDDDDDNDDKQQTIIILRPITETNKIPSDKPRYFQAEVYVSDIISAPIITE